MKDFIQFLLEEKVLLLGDFTLKSGRPSPYFFNFAAFNRAISLKKLSRFYAEELLSFLGLTKTENNNNNNIDIVFGPAYKGISLSIALAAALQDMHAGHANVSYAFNRKELKKHGDAGTIVGAKLYEGVRICIVDDVISSGISIAESINLLRNECPGVHIVCALVGVDRMQHAQNSKEKTAACYIAEKFDVPVISLCTIETVLHRLEQKKLTASKA